MKYLIAFLLLVDFCAIYVLSAPSPLWYRRDFQRYINGFLECNIIGAESVSWTFNGQTISSNDKYSIESNGLRITNIQDEDQGEYDCKDVDPANYYGQPIRYTLRVTQIIPLLTLKELQPNQDGFLECEINEAAGPTSWTYKGQRLNSNNKYTIEPNGLKIANVQESDEGDYICSLTKGGSVHATTVIVTDIKRLP